MSASDDTGSSRAASWVIGVVLLGWLIAYNAIRLTGASPREAAWPSLAIGGGAALALLVVVLVARRARSGAGGRERPEPPELPEPSALSASQREVLRLAAYALGALALAALALGVALIADWVLSEPPERAATALVIGAWDVLVGLWVGDEARRLSYGQAEGAESVVLGCVLTALLGGFGLARSLIEPGQVVVIVLAGLAGAAASVAIWRLAGGRSAPLGAVAAVVIAGLSLAVPLL